ncbi:MAG: haloacid dehalogenase type II [Gemmatimonadales bacterium]|nr:haloacid dehalogenase type II [Gemmatimonadales bacterium]MDZ4390244.1 haloacid dehalogenase type II [Gemmatimonadales bacterium]
MATTLAFDVYGTLIDTAGVMGKVQELVGANAPQFSRVWREKQLEYSFRRGLMDRYADFAICTSEALDYTCSYCKVPLEREQRLALLDCYRTLPAFADVQDGLVRLRAAGCRLFAFSNGSAAAVHELLVAAGIRDLFLGIVSVEALRTFKPNPAVYQHFLQQSGGTGADSWLVSSNPFDVIGALSAGMRAAWVHRSAEVVFDPWGIDPTITVGNLGDLVAHFG